MVLCRTRLVLGDRAYGKAVQLMESTTTQSGDGLQYLGAGALVMIMLAVAGLVENLDTLLDIAAPLFHSKYGASQCRAGSQST